MNFPDLSNAKMISLDVETSDPNLLDKGPGTIRKDGYICGVSIATDDGFAEYLPVNHQIGRNLDRDQVYSWLRKVLSGDQPKLGANILYDLEWLKAEGIDVGGEKIDVQVAEALLDENKQSYKLEALGLQYTGIGKDESGMLEAAIRRGIVKPNDKDASNTLKGNIHKLDPEEVAPYGRQDVLLPLQIWNKQKDELEKQELAQVFQIEKELIDALLLMRFKGVRVDMEVAERNVRKLDKMKSAMEDGLASIAGRAVDYWSNQDLAKACTQMGIAFVKTENKKKDPEGNPSFLGDWLIKQKHPFLTQVSQCRKIDRMGSVFIRSRIIDLAVNGRIHPQFYSVRNDRGGTRSGRFASSNPNMQQVPAKDPDLSPLVRGCFIPEDGEEWACFDWSQIEPRVTVHYAYILGLQGAKEARNKYVEDPSTDYHQMTADMAGIDRKPAKTINLGLSYGMGKAKLAESLDLTYQEAEELSSRYHDALPFIKLLGDKCQRLASSRGYVKTLLGRRRRFELFGPCQGGKGTTPLPRDEALKKFGPRIQRYFVHKAMNAVIQGTAAELMKVLIVLLHREKITPHLTVHDDISESCSSREKMKKIKDIMETTIRDYFKIEVPLKVDVEAGKNWFDIEEVSFE